jgi:hypothetical protein
MRAMDRSVSQSVDRRFIRHPSRLPISFALPNSASRPEECLRNVSEGGVCFASATELQVGSPIRLQIPVFGDQFEVDGNIAWCRPAGRGFEVGVAFYQRQDRFAVRMVEQLCYIEEYRARIEREEGRTLTSEQAAAEWIRHFADQFPGLH